MTVELTKTELDKCMEFARKCANNQQKIEFGQHDTAERKTPEISRDILIGKIAEVAFQKMLKTEYKIDIDLDFNYYPRGIWDAEDAKINGWRIDVKATRSNGNWMLIEWNKLRFRMKENKLSHIYVMCAVGWDRHKDEYTGFVEIVGCASLNKLRMNQEKTLVLRKGERIPNTQSGPLQADNYGIKFDDLQKDFDKVMSYITTHIPFSTEDFTVPE